MIEARETASLAPFATDATAVGFTAVHAGAEPRPIQVTSNVVITDVVKAVVDKTADKEFAEPGDEIQYTVTFRNYSSVDLYGVKIVDDISPKTTLVPDTVVPAPQAGETLGTGVSVTSPNESVAGRVPKGQSARLAYKVTVNAGATGDMISKASAIIQFRDRKGNEYSGSTDPNITKTTILAPDLQIVESADKTFVTENNEEVVYTLVVKNTGTVKITNITVTSPLSDGMTYRQNSTLKKDTNQFVNADPVLGISIGDLDPGESYQIQFSVTVSL